MKTIAVVMVMMMMMATLVAGCSASQMEWVARGQEGLAIEQQQTTEWYMEAVSVVEADRKAIVVAMFRDIKDRTAASQPTEMPMDEWLVGMQSVLLASLDGIDQRKAKLDNRLEQQMLNIGRIHEAFAQIERLNRVYAGDREALAAQVSKLVSIIQQMRAEKE